MMKFIAIIFGILVLGFGCTSKKTSSTAEDYVPQRVIAGEGNVEAATEWVKEYNPSEKMLLVGLDYMPLPTTGTATMPRCFETLSVDFELGFVRCRDGDEIVINAGNVVQICNEKDSMIDPETDLDVGSCDIVGVYHHEFTPQLTFGVQMR